VVLLAITDYRGLYALKYPDSVKALSLPLQSFCRFLRRFRRLHRFFRGLRRFRRLFRWFWRFRRFFRGLRRWSRLLCRDGRRFGRRGSRRGRRRRYEGRPVLGGVTKRALAAPVPGGAGMAGAALGITSVVEGHRRPVIDRMAVRALPRPMVALDMARLAIQRAGMVEINAHPILRIMAVRADFSVMRQGRRSMAGDTVGQSAV
jgi:hypothetical protein